MVAGACSCAHASAGQWGMEGRLLVAADGHRGTDVLNPKINHDILGEHGDLRKRAGE